MFNLFKKMRKRTLFLSLTAIVFAIISLSLLNFGPRRPETAPTGNLTVTFVDVGQGQSVLMETADHKAILVDGGEYINYETHLQPYLNSRGIEQIHTAIVSHYHSDHMGGISELVKEGRVKRLVLPDYPDTDKSRSAIEEYAKDTETDVVFVGAGDKIDCNYHGLLIDVLHPQKGGIESQDYHNANSLVLRIIYGKTAMLLTGDITASEEYRLCKLKENIECEILQIAHHGSSSSTSERFLDKTNPTYAVIQSGAGNSYGHPHREVLSVLEDSDARTFRNDKDGHITFVISPTTIESTSFTK